MEAEFWHERWRENRIGFHEGAPNAHLVAWFDRLGLSAAARVFVPLCGKTADIGWLVARGLRVAGAELNPLAVEQLFEGLGLAPKVTAHGPLTHYAAAGIDIWQGDIFALSAERLGPVDAIHDRAALVALPPDMRPGYARHMQALTGTAPQLLIAFDYDQSRMDGPPFSVSEDEIRRHYDGPYQITPLARTKATGRVGEQSGADETVWHLTPR